MRVPESKVSLGEFPKTKIAPRQKLQVKITDLESDHA